MPITLVDPAGLSTAPSYSHVAITTAGRTAHVSGQVAVDAKGAVVGKGDLRAQGTQVYENMKAALAGVGLTFRDVAKIVTYVVDITPEKANVLREVRAQYFPKDHKPASTMVGVTGLVNPDLLVEVEAVALLKD